MSSSAMNLRLIRMGTWLILIVLAVWLYAGRRVEPNHVSIALRHVPEGCTAVGAWRDAGSGGGEKGDGETLVLCNEGRVQHMLRVLDRTPKEVDVVDVDFFGANVGPSPAAFALNPDGSLSVRDDLGQVRTVKKVDF